MPQVQPPPVQPGRQISDIERFAKAYFGIELTSYQIQTMRTIFRGIKIEASHPKKMGVTTINKVVRAYLAEGIDPYGRARLPQFNLPAHLGRSKIKAATQEGKVLAMIKRPGGAFNFELSRIALKYTSVISDLRKDGHDIVADRQYLKNGKASNTWRYRLGGH